MSSPTVTLAGNTQTLLGTTDVATITYELAGFGNAIPCISGTALFTTISGSVTCSGGAYSFTVYGNDVITVLGVANTTWYVFKFFSSTGQLIATVPYQLSGSGTFDISSLTPLSAPVPPASVPSSGLITALAAAASSPFSLSITNPNGPSTTVTLGLVAQNANLVFAGPTSGGAANPSMRAMIVADLPTSGTWPFAGTISGNFTANGTVTMSGTIAGNPAFSGAPTFASTIAVNGNTISKSTDPDSTGSVKLSTGLKLMSSLVVANGSMVVSQEDAYLELVNGGQDYFIQAGPRGIEGTITATSITVANRLDVTYTAGTGTYGAGNTVYLSGTAEAFLNGQIVTVLASPAPTSTSFSANFTHANFTNNADTGTCSTGFLLATVTATLPDLTGGTSTPTSGFLLGMKTNGIPSGHLVRINAAGGLCDDSGIAANNGNITMSPTGGNFPQLTWNGSEASAHEYTILENAGALILTDDTASNATRLTVGSTGGLQVGAAPTGGDKGTGTINVQSGIYLNNTAYTNPDYVFEKWATGRIERFKDNPGAEGYEVPTVEEVEAYARQHLQLPHVADRRELFSRADVLLEKVEELYIHIFELTRLNKELSRRIAALESRQ